MDMRKYKLRHFRSDADWLEIGSSEEGGIIAATAVQEEKKILCHAKILRINWRHKEVFLPLMDPHFLFKILCSV